SENRYEKAVVALTAYGFLKPLSKQEKQLMADLYLSIGIPIKAADFYEDILLKRMDPEILKRLVHSYLNLHNPQKALETVEKGLKHIPDDKLLMLKGQVLYEMERYREAMAAFEKTGSKNPERGQAWLMIGYTAWHVDDIEKARRAFENAAKYQKQRKTAQKVLRRLGKLPSR
ncbi:MAG: tetratricopeptide repeat protein, partial [Deltaproteobacteria bacterium]|nr:tetratricopeptide repeat protein [Deltaproteobacteria bacterium]